jgi:hypothetical protein
LAAACYPFLGDEAMASSSRAKIKNPAMAAPKIMVGGPPIPALSFNYAYEHEPDLFLKREILVENS